MQPSRPGAGLPLLRDVGTYPPSLLGSGRRYCAGPGLAPSTPEGLGRALGIALLVGLATALMISPALFATLSMTLDLQVASWLTGLKVMPVLEAGRVLVTVALVAKVVATKELE